MDRATTLITGGAGFVGCNLAASLLREGAGRIRIFDNLSRAGVAHNLEWLRGLPGAQDNLEVVQGDVRDAGAVNLAARDAIEIYHLAAQVAVTSSLIDPTADFHVNAAGTLHVLEAARKSGRNPFVLFTSTNKVYGSLENVPTALTERGYRFAYDGFSGVGEEHPLDFHSPYGCSKGAADQYVRDYARIYGLPAVVFRMSCIAGPRQFGNEDQGWVAHFLYTVLAGKPVTIYGDGHQVRDVLHVSDLVNAMRAARDAKQRTAGQVYNVGGGPARSVSVMDMLRAIEERSERVLRVRFREVRPGDQPIYISDTTKLERDTGWLARHSLEQTLDSIYKFWEDHREEITRRDVNAYADKLEQEVA